jgi:LmbE family N-acetylglucosaminyl deacetylase
MHQLRPVESGRGVLAGAASVLIIAPHPDDETIACAAPLSEAGVAGLPGAAVLMTNGEAHEAACAVAACRRDRIAVGPGLFGAAVRILLGSTQAPQARIVVTLTGAAAKGAMVRLAGPAGIAASAWVPLNRLGWAVLRASVAALAAGVEVSWGGGRRAILHTRLAGPEDRRALGRVRVGESRAALRRLGFGAPLLLLGLPDGRAGAWWNFAARRPAGPGVAALDKVAGLALSLPVPVALFAPATADRDVDHAGTGRFATGLAGRLRQAGRAAWIWRYLVHHPSGEGPWRAGQPAPGLPPYDAVELVAPSLKRGALRRYVSQLRVDLDGLLMSHASGEEGFWKDCLLEKEADAWAPVV